MTESPTTYRVTAVNATVRDRPGGQPLRRLSRGETFQERAVDKDWIVRVDDAFMITGYIRAVNVEPVQ